MKINIASNEVIHFIGIGGIGMSGLAQIMNNMGFTIQGSDLSRNKNTERLIKSGMKVYFGHHQKNLKKATMIVISSAIKKNNKELKAAKLKKLPVFQRGEMLANIVALKKNIVVAGAHGKTTTTSLVANILVEAGLDPTVINGGVINSLKNNAQLGKGEWAVIESDESDGSFLKLPVFGDMILKSLLARISLIMGNLSAAGVNLLEALEIAKSVSNNVVVTEALENVKKGVFSGDTLTKLFLKEPLFPPTFSQLIAVGEQTGNLDEMFNSVAMYFEEEFDSAVDNMSSLIEPIMIVFMGIMIGGLMIAMYSPIFNVGALIG